MTYTIEFAEPAEKQFRKLEKNIQERILLALDRIKIRPYSFVKKLVGYQYYRMVIGDYRVIMDIRNNQLLILVAEVGHRKNIYK